MLVSAIHGRRQSPPSSGVTFKRLEPSDKSHGCVFRVLFALLVCAVVTNIWLVLRSPYMTLHEDQQKFSEMGNQIGSLPLLVDERCLQQLLDEEPCDGTLLAVASFRDDLVEHHDLLALDYMVSAPADSNYLLFTATDAIARRRAVPRSDEFVERQVEIFTSNVRMLVPTDIRRFLRHFTQGLLIDCLNLDMQRPSQDRKIPLSYINDMSEFVAWADRFNVTLMLHAGTLLGWLRECSLIPHTHDIDFVVRRQEVDQTFFRALTTHYRLLYRWGALNSSLEYSLYIRAGGDKITDLFVLYPNSSEPNMSYTSNWHPTGTLRQSLYPPVDRICTGIMHNTLFYVPCNAEAMLEVEYGDAWRLDRPSSSYNPYKVQNLRVWHRFESAEFEKLYRAFPPPL